MVPGVAEKAIFSRLEVSWVRASLGVACVNVISMVIDIDYFCHTVRIGL